MKTPPGTASKGHTYQCHSCGWSHQRVAAVIFHIRTAHARNVSRPEYYPVTDRQARDFLASVRRER